MPDLSDAEIQRIVQAAVTATLTQTTRLAREDASDIAAAAATKAVNEAHIHLFAHLGYDLANKEDLKRLRANMDFMERFRQRCDTIGQSVTSAVSNTIAIVFLTLLALGAYFWMHQGNPPTSPQSLVK